VNSGYRCPVLNKAVGGVPTSQHQKGEAADLTVGSPELNQQLFDLIAKGDFDFDQLIDESNYGWVHISYSAGKNRHKILHL
jgi:zinc D-Ala-D-Ala carboxypeptidase